MNKINIIRITWWIIVLSVMLFLISSIYIHYETFTYKTISIDHLYKICNTGDIILFRWSHVDVGFRLFSKFCHIGIIFKDKKGNPFILETHPKETYNPKGVNVYPLKKRLIEYGGYCYISKLINYNNININTNVISKNIKKYKKIPFDDHFRYNFVKSWFYNLFNIQKQPRDVMYCSELIAHVLKDINLIDNHSDITSFSPTTFTHVKNKLNKPAFGNIYRIST